MADSQPIKSTVEWRYILGFPGYRVSNNGDVESCWEQYGLGNLVIGVAWHRLIGRPIPTGYLRVTLCRDGKRHDRYIHRLVLEAFVGPCPKGMQCRHFPDPDKSNNKLENLSWSTIKENHADKLVHGTHHRGERNPQAKLTAKDVREIRLRVLAGERMGDIAREFGVSPSNITVIMKYERWRHVI